MLTRTLALELAEHEINVNNLAPRMVLTPFNQAAIDDPQLLEQQVQSNGASIEGAFGDPDFLWVRGGNVFTLRMAMATSGLDRLIAEGLEGDRFVYGGFSAGSCVLAPSLKGLEVCDPPGVCRAADGNVRYDGLGVLDRPVVPHLNSPQHPETALLARVAAQYDLEGQPFWAMSDGQALVLEGPEMHIH